MVNIIAIFVLAGFAIYWENRVPAYWHYILKPLTTLGIILFAITQSGSLHHNYPQLIIVGLVFSLAGDVFLMLPGDKFIPGLVSFLLAQIVYSAAFVFYASEYSLLIGFPILIYGAWMYYQLHPHLGTMKIPVLIYMICILVMVWSALNLWWDTGKTFAVFATVGAIFFVISDSVLAWNRFASSRSYFRPLVLSTYFLAQLLIAQSVIR